MSQFEQHVGEHVVITTDKDRRGVFTGILEAYDEETGEATLSEARNIVYWSKPTRGVVGLAAIGPQGGSRVSPAAPELSVNGVTAVMRCTDEAVERLREEPWS